MLLLAIGIPQYPQTNIQHQCPKTVCMSMFSLREVLADGQLCCDALYLWRPIFFWFTAQVHPQIIVDNYNNKTRDIVVVTFAYRMNVFGLLNLNYRMTDLLSPNLALHDILDSLRWTKREIASFGALPKNRNQRSSRRMAYSLDCVTKQQWQSPDFWSVQRNVEQTLNCLRQVNASSLSAHVRLLEDQGFLFHGLARKLDLEQ
uniref:Carboxylesterase type B domain-containing protein n=1 Tax=Ditylenchus dipsaci TaxID=166011 RepID=A0A915EGJ9_9BILA